MNGKISENSGFKGLNSLLFCIKLKAKYRMSFSENTKEENIMGQKKTGRKTIQGKIMLQIGRSVLGVMIAIAVVAVVIMYSLVTFSKETELTLESESASHQLADFFDQYIRMSEEMAVNPEIRMVMQEAGKGDSLLDMKTFPTVYKNMCNIAQSDTENIMAAWMADIDANMVTQSDDFTSGEGWEITQRAWYPCIAANESMLTEPYVDASTGQTILSTVAPVYSEKGEPLGVAGLDISLAHVIEVMAEYTIGESGYVVLFSSQGTVVYHPDESKIQMNVKDLDVSQEVKDCVLNREEAFLRYKLGGDGKYGNVKLIGDTGYVVLSSLSVSEYYDMLVKTMLAILVIFVLGIVLVVYSIRKVSGNLTKPIVELNQTAYQLAEGNLDVELNVETEDEIGELGESIGRTVERLKQYIAYIDETSEVLGRMADGKLAVELKYDYTGEFQKVKTALLQISDSMNMAMTSMKESAYQVSAGADDLADASQGLAESASTQAAAVEELVATTITVSEQVKENRQKAEESAEKTGQVNAMMEQSRKAMDQMMSAMDKIQETSHQVVGIIQTIEEIADQTNLLSLNASIEAARAGEAGRGFAVVADQIGKLAEESAQAANTTRNLIGVSMDEINRGNELAGQVTAALQEAVEAVDMVNQLIRQTAENTIEEAESMEQIRRGVEDISQSIQDNSAMAEESSATSEELAAQATTLNEIVARFELAD